MGSIVGAIAGGAASSLVGKVLGGGKSKSVPTGGSQTQIDPRANFKPVTLTTGVGSAKLTGGDNGLTIDGQLDPRLQALQDLGFGSAGDWFNKYQEGLNLYQPRVLGAQWDPNAATNSYYQSQMDIMRPEMARQNEALKQSLFGSGRLGLQLASQAAGAGEGNGMVNPDAYGLSLAQNRAMNEAYNTSRQKGLAEQSAMLGFLGTQDASQLGLLKDYLGAGTGMFNLGSRVNDQLMDLIKNAMNLEVQRSGTYTGNSTVTNTGQQETLGSQMAGALAPKIGGAVGDWAGGLFGGNNIVPVNAWSGTMGSQVSGVNPLTFMP